jgi:hypothetical protein
LSHLKEVREAHKRYYHETIKKDPARYRACRNRELAWAAANKEKVNAAKLKYDRKSLVFAQKLTEFVMPLLPIEAQFEVMKMWTEHAGANNARSTD